MAHQSEARFVQPGLYQNDFQPLVGACHGFLSKFASRSVEAFAWLIGRIVQRLWMSSA